MNEFKQIPEYNNDVAEKANSLPNTTPMGIGKEHAGFLMNDKTVELVGKNDQGQITLHHLKNKNIKDISLCFNSTGLL